jgi:hypothetical protein
MRAEPALCPVGLGHHCLVPNDGRAALIAALATGNPADQACRQALIEGATFDAHEGTVPVDNLAVIYARRVEHLRANGTRFVGDDVVERLRLSQYRAVRLTGVNGADNYVVFLSPDDDHVVGSIGVDGAVANPDFYRS